MFVVELQHWKDITHVEESKAGETKKMFLSKQTFTGLVMTSKDMVGVVRFLLN